MRAAFEVLPCFAHLDSMSKACGYADHRFLGALREPSAAA